jgi:hypothetical protein
MLIDYNTKVEKVKFKKKLATFIKNKEEHAHMATELKCVTVFVNKKYSLVILLG